MSRGKDIIKISIQKNLSEISQKHKKEIPEEVINYISSIIALYYKGIPFYLIDIKETNPFKRNKIRGDVSLLLVGFFKEWINRKNRPLTENDYINAGKLSYFNVYLYLENHYGELFYNSSEKQFLNENEVFGYINLFKNLSEEFEEYTEFLRVYREEVNQIKSFFDTFKELRFYEFKRILGEETS